MEHPAAHAGAARFAADAARSGAGAGAGPGAILRRYDAEASIVSSPQGRALATARLVAEQAAIAADAIGTDARLSEMTWGAMDSHTVPEIETKWPGQVAARPALGLGAAARREYAMVRERLRLLAAASRRDGAADRGKPRRGRPRGARPISVADAGRGRGAGRAAACRLSPAGRKDRGDRRRRRWRCDADGRPFFAVFPGLKCVREGEAK